MLFAVGGVMSFHHWFLYLLVIVALIGMPGPSAMLCLSHGALHGGRRAIATVAGGVLASLTLMSLSVMGYRMHTFFDLMSSVGEQDKVKG